MSLAEAISCTLPFVAFFFPFSIFLTNLSLGILMWMVVALLIKKRCPWKADWNPALKALVLYSVVGMIVIATGIDPRHSIEETGKDWHKPVALTIMLVTLGYPSKWRLERVLAGSFGLAALVGICQSATERAGTAWIRAHAFVHPVTYGEILACAILGALCFWGRAETGGQSRAAKRWTAGFLLLAGTALVLNQTRGAVLGLAVGYAAVCLFDKAMRRRALIAAGVLVGIAALWEVMPTGGRSLSALLHYRLHTPTGAINPYLARYEFWSVAWRVFLDHPWLGVGQGNFKTVFTHYTQGIAYDQTDWGSAHDLYLHQLAERGLIGFAALTAALGTLTVRAYRRARANPNAWNLWAWGAMVAFLVMNLTEVVFQNELATTFFLFVWAWAEINGEIPAGKVL